MNPKTRTLLDLKVGDPVEVTHHMTMSSKWFAATVVKVTPNFVDVRRDDCLPDAKPTRYRKATGRELGGYCGFYSNVRVPQPAAAKPSKVTP